jgi:hypothetical protein
MLLSSNGAFVGGYYKAQLPFIATLNKNLTEKR